MFVAFTMDFGQQNRCKLVDCLEFNITFNSSTLTAAFKITLAIVEAGVW